MLSWVFSQNLAHFQLWNLINKHATFCHCLFTLVLKIWLARFKLEAIKQIIKLVIEKMSKTYLGGYAWALLKSCNTANLLVMIINGSASSIFYKWLKSVANQTGAFFSFCSMKWLELFLLPLDGMLVHRRVMHQPIPPVPLRTRQPHSICLPSTFWGWGICVPRGNLPEFDTCGFKAVKLCTSFVITRMEAFAGLESLWIS